jgi:GAF domain-containing protein
VHAFPGHIACDAASRSELVIPLLWGGKCVGVLDLDSPEIARFTQDEALFLENLVKEIWPHVWQERE